MKITVALCTVIILTSFAFAQKKSTTAAPAPTEATRPESAHESLDLSTYGRIREEGLAHSRVMDYATALFDDIGPRLTGSPNLDKAYKWTSDQFTAMGCSNVHLENWGDFGLGWRQIAPP